MKKISEGLIFLFAAGGITLAILFFIPKQSDVGERETAFLNPPKTLDSSMRDLTKNLPSSDEVALAKKSRRLHRRGAEPSAEPVSQLASQNDQGVLNSENSNAAATHSAASKVEKKVALTGKKIPASSTSLTLNYYPSGKEFVNTPENDIPNRENSSFAWIGVSIRQDSQDNITAKPLLGSQP